MADNLDITPGNGSKKHRSHESGDVHTPIHKIALGATNADETILEAGRQAPADSLPVVTPLEAPTFQTIAQINGSTLTTSMQTVGTWTAGTRIGSLVNTTPVWVVFSCNGGTNPHRRLPPNSKENIDFGSNGLTTDAAVWCKHDGTAAPSGTVSIEGIK